MTTLQQISQANPEWDLDAFVQIANDLLPQFLPLDAENRRTTPETVNPRLVRYYTTQGVLDRPLRQGRESRYGYRHLLQLLVVRRLLNEGYSTNAIQPITLQQGNQDLEALLQGGVQLTVKTVNPALAFLQSVQARRADGGKSDATARSRALPSPPAAAPSLAPPAPGGPPFTAAGDRPTADPAASHWLRVEILPGLEVQVRDTFVPPGTPQELENLLQLIAQKLTPLFQSRRCMTRSRLSDR